MSEPNGKSTPIDLDKLGSQMVERAEWLSVAGDAESARVMLVARRAIGILLAQVPPPKAEDKPVPEATNA